MTRAETLFVPLCFLLRSEVMATMPLASIESKLRSLENVSGCKSVEDIRARLLQVEEQNRMLDQRLKDLKDQILHKARPRAHAPISAPTPTKMSAPASMAAHQMRAETPSNTLACEDVLSIYVHGWLRDCFMRGWFYEGKWAPLTDDEVAISFSRHIKDRKIPIPVADQNQREFWIAFRNILWGDARTPNLLAIGTYCSLVCSDRSRDCLVISLADWKRPTMNGDMMLYMIPPVEVCVRHLTMTRSKKQ